MFEKAFEKYRAIEEDKLKHYKFLGPKYHDYPEGEDLVGKLIATSRWSVLFGVISGLSHIVVPPFCKSYKQMLIVCLAKIIPPVMITSSFTITTFYATKFRKVDDATNYALGGLAVGGVIGSLKNNVIIGMFTGASIALGASFYKSQKMHSVRSFRYARDLDPYYIRKLDFTIVPEKEQLWKKELNSPVN